MSAGTKRREEIFFNLWKFYPAKALEHRAFGAIAAPALRGRVLDIGGGLGPYRESLSYTSYYSLEINPALSPDIVGSALDLPVRSGATDSVLCNEVLEHLPDPAGAVREIHRVLQPGGRVYVTVPFLWCLHYGATIISGLRVTRCGRSSKGRDFACCGSNRWGGSFPTWPPASRKSGQSREEALLLPATPDAAVRGIAARRPGQRAPVRDGHRARPDQPARCLLLRLARGEAAPRVNQGPPLALQAPSRTSSVSRVFLSTG